MPYTSFMALHDAGAPVKIVAGGGVEGCAIVARPGLDILFKYALVSQCSACPPHVASWRFRHEAS